MAHILRTRHHVDIRPRPHGRAYFVDMHGGAYFHNTKAKIMTPTPEQKARGLEERCREFVEEQSCGEWSEKDVAMDTKKLHEFVLREIAAARAGGEG